MGFEKYIPGPEEIAKAENQMSNPEKELTELREGVHENVLKAAQESGIQKENIRKINLDFDPEGILRGGRPVIVGKLDGNQVMIAQNKNGTCEGKIADKDGKSNLSDLNPLQAKNLWNRYFKIAQEMSKLSSNWNRPSGHRINRLEHEAAKERSKVVDKKYQDLMEL